MILVLCDKVGKSLVKYDLGKNAFQARELDVCNAADLRIAISEPVTVTKFYITNNQDKVLWVGNFDREMSVGNGDYIVIPQGKLRIGLSFDPTEPVPTPEALIS